MNACSILNRGDYEDHVIGLYFGEPPNWLSTCIEHAYGEISRTLRGLAQVPGKQELHDQAVSLLEDEFGQLAGSGASVDARQFDAWHRQVCLALPKLYASAGYPKMSVGQAQRWINTTFRLVFTLGPGRLPGFERIYPLCHLPIHTRIIETLEPKGLPSLRCSWARLEDYERYMVCQYWVRESVAFSALDVDLLLLLGRYPELNLN